MAKFESVADELAEDIVSNSLSKDLCNIIRSKIDNLSYTENGKSISAEDKLVIIELLEHKLGSPSVNSLTETNLSAQESEDFRDLVKLLKRGYINHGMILFLTFCIEYKLLKLYKTKKA